MPSTIVLPNKEQDDKCDKWIDMSCEKKNITLRDLYNVCGQINQQLEMKKATTNSNGWGWIIFTREIDCFLATMYHATY